MTFSDWSSLKSAPAEMYDRLHTQEQARLGLLNLSQWDRSAQTTIADFMRLGLLIPDLDEHIRAMMFINGLKNRVHALTLNEHPTTLSAASCAVLLADLPGGTSPRKRYSIHPRASTAHPSVPGRVAVEVIV
eukprot:scpid54736/ scgid12762/ 